MSPTATATITPQDAPTTMLDDFLIRAALAGIGLTLATGPLGSFVVWRRMAYFGDATSHAAILGVALAFGFGLPLYAGTLVVALAMALTVAALSGRGHAMDTVLGVLAHAALAFGLVAASFISGLRVDLTAFLFGDILAVSRTDLAVVWGGSAVVAVLLIWRWQELLTATVNEELAQASGQDPLRARLVLTLALALTVAVAIKIVGALLIAALLIIPAAAARQLARGPESMALAATAIGATSVLGGLQASLNFDTPAGPSIVVVAALIFVLSLGVKRRG
ncbi:zinc transport system permease protein [Rhodobacter aestuarii]|uniref:High-affinity zinc uptake system membrane protein ZnuB n=2 Tax=Rhodobacter aestuarii TaxID=453582 RepID=A0A1N7PB60_9RHOB|nr:zinc transport system permease protein [Rhodobacter aestuarii]SIT07788.1 zinc transport system permease protein [Rhodobacter aestuarii]